MQRAGEARSRSTAGGPSALCQAAQPAQAALRPGRSERAHAPESAVRPRKASARPDSDLPNP
eukprot:4806396-Alexandrium_andersonii.AAC.1